MSIMHQDDVVVNDMKNNEYISEMDLKLKEPVVRDAIKLVTKRHEEVGEIEEFGIYERVHY